VIDPKKLKNSGKGTLAKKKTAEKKVETKKVKVRLRDKKNIGKRRVPTPKAEIAPIVES
jgi:hypothetical protein